MALTINDTFHRFLANIKRGKARKTYEAYSQAITYFGWVLEQHAINPEVIPISELSPKWVDWLLDSLVEHSVATERLYCTVVYRWYRFVAARELAQVNLGLVREYLDGRRTQGRRIPDFPSKDIERLLAYAEQSVSRCSGNERQWLRLLRNRALLFTLADTGLRVSEACSLQRGQINWDKGYFKLIGKGDKQAIVYISQRAMDRIKAYLNARAGLDRQQRQQMAALPVFARHDRGAGKRILPISSRAAEKIVEGYTATALGEEKRGEITPHSFRHYFVTRAMRATGGNIHVVQRMARHESIQTTERYTHLTDEEVERAYHQVFNK